MPLTSIKMSIRKGVVRWIHGAVDGSAFRTRHGSHKYANSTPRWGALDVGGYGRTLDDNALEGPRRLTYVLAVEGERPAKSEGLTLEAVEATKLAQQRSYTRWRVAATVRRALRGPNGWLATTKPRVPSYPLTNNARTWRISKR